MPGEDSIPVAIKHFLEEKANLPENKDHNNKVIKDLYTKWAVIEVSKTSPLHVESSAVDYGFIGTANSKSLASQATRELIEEYCNLLIEKKFPDNAVKDIQAVLTRIYKEVIDEDAANKLSEEKEILEKLLKERYKISDSQLSDIFNTIPVFKSSSSEVVKESIKSEIMTILEAQYNRFSAGTPASAVTSLSDELSDEEESPILIANPTETPAPQPTQPLPPESTGLTAKLTPVTPVQPKPATIPPLTPVSMSPPDIEQAAEEARLEQVNENELQPEPAESPQEPAAKSTITQTAEKKAKDAAKRAREAAEETERKAKAEATLAAETVLELENKLQEAAAELKRATDKKDIAAQKTAEDTQKNTETELAQAKHNVQIKNKQLTEAVEKTDEAAKAERIVRSESENVIDVFKEVDTYVKGKKTKRAAKYSALSPEAREEWVKAGKVNLGPSAKINDSPEQGTGSFNVKLHEAYEKADGTRIALKIEPEHYPASAKDLISTAKEAAFAGLRKTPPEFLKFSSYGFEEPAEMKGNIKKGIDEINEMVEARKKKYLESTASVSKTATSSSTPTPESTAATTSVARAADLTTPSSTSTHATAAPMPTTPQTKTASLTAASGTTITPSQPISTMQPSQVVQEGTEGIQQEIERLQTKLQAITKQLENAQQQKQGLQVKQESLTIENTTLKTLIPSETTAKLEEQKKHELKEREELEKAKANVEEEIKALQARLQLQPSIPASPISSLPPTPITTSFTHSQVADTKSTIEPVQNAFSQKDNPSYQYSASDIDCVLQQYKEKYNHVEILDVMTKPDDIKKIFDKAKENKSENKPYLGILNIGDNHWICFSALCVFEPGKENKMFFLYKDSLGGETPEELNQILSEQYKNVNLHRKSFIKKEHDDVTSSGIFALENLRILSEELDPAKKHGAKLSKFDNLVLEFGMSGGFKPSTSFKTTIKFCDQAKAEELRKDEFANDIVLSTYDSIKKEPKYAEGEADNTKFLEQVYAKLGATTEVQKREIQTIITKYKPESPPAPRASV